MMEWTTACPDWEERIVAKQSLIPCKPLFPEVAEIAQEVFGGLIVPDMMGRPLMRDVMPLWVMEFVGVIFGGLDPDAMRRLIKEFFLLISKKNAKSTIAAGIMLTALELNERDLTEATIIAPTKEVADNAFKPAMGMVIFDPEMAEKYTVSPHVRTITHISTQSTLKVMAADDKSTGGSKAAYVLIDELHLFGEVADAEAILSEATGGLMSKPDGFIIKLTTQSTNPPAGVFADELSYARDVRDGKIQDKTYLPLLYEFPNYLLDNEQYLDSENFYITNPNIGYSVDEEYLISKYKKAEAKGDTALQEFLAKHLNVEIGLRLRSNRWSGADFWIVQASKSPLTLESLIEQSEIVVVGGDGGGLDDLLGMSVIGRRPDKSWLLWNRAWCNQIVLERRKKIAPKLEQLQKLGELVIVDRVGPDCDEFGMLCGQISQAGKLYMIGLDPMKKGSLENGICTAGGIDPELIIGISQGWRLSEHIQTLERKLAEGSAIHANQELMNWCVGNAKSIVKGSNQLITKESAGINKIDPLIATFNATALMAQAPEPPKPSVYETRGIRMIG